MAVSAGIALGSMAASFVVQDQRQDKIEERQDEVREREEAIQNERAARERRKQIAQRQVLQAQIANQAANVGQGGSSAVAVSQGAVAGSTGQNIGQINTDVAMSDALSSAQSRLASAGNLSFGQQFVLNTSNAVASRAAGNVGAAAGNKIANSIFTP